LQYLIGLTRLGHVVHFVEPVSGLLPDANSPGRAQAPGKEMAGLADAVRYCGLVLNGRLRQGKWALLDPAREVAMPLSYPEVRSLISRCDLFLNLSGLLRAEELTSRIPVRVYVDLDPGFTQLWQTAEGLDMGLAGHTHYVTVGGRIGLADCPVPTCGIKWIRSLPPVVLDHWRFVGGCREGAVTTVGHWRSYGSVKYKGVFYGQRAHSFRELFALPGHTSERFLIALGIDSGESADLTALQENGWMLLDPAHVAGDPDAYMRFLQSSKAELSVAKSGYVVSRCGWFSDRSACYLASGKPVAALDTGFGHQLPVGEGLLGFGSADEASEVVAKISGDYERHSMAARKLAEEYLDSNLVLQALLREVGLS
jgi:hypothetical protein